MENKMQNKLDDVKQSSELILFGYILMLKTHENHKKAFARITTNLHM